MVNITDEKGHKIESLVEVTRADLIVRDLPGSAVLVVTDGTTIPVRGTVSPLTEGDRQFKGIIFTFAPVTREHILGFSTTV